MLIRSFTASLVAAALLAGQPRTVTDQEVREVHRSALLIDTHNDVTGRTVEGWDIGADSSDTHTDLKRLKKGGVGATFFAAYVAARYARDKRAAYRALEVIDSIRHDIAGRYPADFQLAVSADEVVAARKAGKIAVLIGVEGGHAIEDSLRVLRSFYALGARYMTLTHSNTNNWADSSGDIGNKTVKHHNGLTKFGREVVAEMNRLGMMVDVSHVSDKTFRDVLEVSRAPVFASHSSARAISNIPRNMTDEMIKAMAAKGGVIQINFGCEFLSQRSADSSVKLWAAAEREEESLRKRFPGDEKKQRAEWERIYRELRAKTVPATLDDVVRHIEHVVKIAGIGAVGIGSDFDGVTCVPQGLADVSEFPNLTRALLERGYRAEDIRAIYGGNLLRVMRSVEKAAGAR